MSLEQIENTLLTLPPDERRRFARWFYEHEDRIVESDDDLSPEVEAELSRRLDEIREHPELIQPWEGTIERVRQRLHELRRQENPSR
jgi:hypothetical protein